MTAVLRAPVAGLPQTRTIDFSRELVVAVGGDPRPTTPVVAAPRADVEVPLTIVWHPVWIVRGCVGRLAGNEAFHAHTREQSGTVWVLRSDATYAVPRVDTHFTVALVEVEVPCPADARELLTRQIPREAVPAAPDGAPTRLPTYALRSQPTGDGAPPLTDVDFSRTAVVVAADAPLALPLRLTTPPAYAVQTRTLAAYRAHYPVLTCRRELPCEHAAPGACGLDYAALRRDRRPALVRVPNRGDPVVRWESGDLVADPDCKHHPRTFTVRSADDPRAPQDPSVDYASEMLVGLDVDEPAPTTILEPIAASEQRGALVVTIEVPIHAVIEVFGCEDAGQRPCDPIPRPTGKTRVRPDWLRVVSGALYRVPRSEAPVQLKFRVAERPPP